MTTFKTSKINRKIEMDRKSWNTYIMFLVLLSVSMLFTWPYWMIYFLFVLLVYVVLFYTLHMIWSFLRRKQITDFISFSLLFLNKLFVSVYVILWLLILFCVYHNQIRPVSTPIFVLSNWSKTVYFQTMMHIGTLNYYQSVKNYLADSKRLWAVLFYEWVKLDDEEKHKKFDKLMWLKFSKDFYENFAKMYGLVNQDNNQFLWVVNDNDINVDVSISTLIENYEKKYGQIDMGHVKWMEVLDLNNVIVDRMSNLHDHQMVVFRYLNLSLINFVSKNQWFGEYLTWLLWKDKLMDIILNERNKVIANNILDSEYSKIHVMYGKLHYEWVFGLLKNADSKWNLIKTIYVYPTR